MDKKSLEERVMDIINKYHDNTELYNSLRRLWYRIERCPSVPFASYKSLAKLTKYINYDCRFKDGHCKEYNMDMCCCANCFGFAGFFYLKFFNELNEDDYIEKQLLYYAKRFKYDIGFWREGKGCVLPRERRSITCLTFNCAEGMIDKERLVIAMLRDYRRMKEKEYIMPESFALIVKILIKYFKKRDK